jgi:CheY-like chemotaxis protein
MKILLVDDDAFLRDMYATKFAEHNHDVAAAENPTVALQQLEAAQDFDVILLDMVMPGMTGAELVKTVKESYPDFKGKCIVLSNQGQQDDIDAAKTAGADGYIIKAESIPSDVVTKVEKIVAEKA